MCLRLFLITTAFFLPLHAFSQKRKTRNVDLKVELDRFNEGDTFYTPGNIFSRMYIINKGPDSVFKGDMLHIEYKFGGYYYNPTFPPAGASLGIGDTLVFAKYISSNGYLNVFNGTFCGFARVAKIYNTDSLIYETPLQEKDNWSCMKANHIALLSSKDMPVSSHYLFPNPCRDYFFIPRTNSRKVKIYSIDGRLIELPEPTIINSKGEELYKFDISNLQGGLYIIQTSISTYRLMVIKN